MFMAMTSSSLRKVLVMALPGLLSACIVVPHTVEHYDADCRITAKHMELAAGPYGEIKNCRDTADCTGQLVSVGVFSAAAVVVSGSIVITGNVVYWLEKQGRCRRVDARNTPVGTTTVSDT